MERRNLNCGNAMKLISERKTTLYLSSVGANIQLPLVCLQHMQKHFSLQRFLKKNIKGKGLKPKKKKSVLVG